MPKPTDQPQAQWAARLLSDLDRLEHPTAQPSPVVDETPVMLERWLRLYASHRSPQA
jgi:hypothetical protein